MEKLLVIGLGGFLGAIARYGVSGLVQRWCGASFPWGTLVVNVLGCLIIGAVMALIEFRQPFSANMRLFLLVGLLGSFTTFSTLGHETYALLEDGSFGRALGNMAVSLALGLGAVFVGRALVKLGAG